MAGGNRDRGGSRATTGSAAARRGGTTGVHTQHEDHPWEIRIPDHTARTDTPAYVRARSLMNRIAASVTAFAYGSAPYHDHHGGGLWLKDQRGWFLVRNMAGIEWSGQFCADPKKVDTLRLNARRLYAGFPEAVKELRIRTLLDTPITDAAGIQRWTDSICNASVPVPPALHTGVLPGGSGVHHYPTPIVDIMFFKHDDFELFVKDTEGKPAVVVPTSPRGSGDGRVRVVFATPNTKLDRRRNRAKKQGKPLILPARSTLARQAFAQQTRRARYGRTTGPA